jgi:hypothetical protein
MPPAPDDPPAPDVTELPPVPAFSPFEPPQAQIAMPSIPASHSLGDRCSFAIRRFSLAVGGLILASTGSDSSREKWPMQVMGGRVA